MLTSTIGRWTATSGAILSARRAASFDARAVAALDAAKRAETLADFRFWDADALEARCSRRMSLILRGMAKLRLDRAVGDAPFALAQTSRAMAAMELRLIEALTRRQAARDLVDLRRAQADAAWRNLQAAMALTAAHPPPVDR